MHYECVTGVSKGDYLGYKIPNPAVASQAQIGSEIHMKVALTVTNIMFHTVVLRSEKNSVG